MHPKPTEQDDADDNSDSEADVSRLEGTDAIRHAVGYRSAASGGVGGIGEALRDRSCKGRLDR